MTLYFAQELFCYTYTQNWSLYTIIDKVPCIISRFRNIAEHESFASIGAYGLYGQDLLRFADVVSSCLYKKTRVLKLFVLGTSTFSRRDKCGGALRRLLHSADFADFQRFSTSATRDCKRDIYSRFLYLARDISRSLLIIIG